MLRHLAAATLVAGVVAGCAETPPPAPVAFSAPPAHDRLYRPERVEKGRLEYTPDYQTFAPVMTQRVAYPTQTQANHAFQRSQWSGQTVERIVTKEGVKYRRAEIYQSDAAVAGVRLFACKPGVINPITMRIQNSRGEHLVHCATDLLDAADRPVARLPLNFYHWRGVWNLHDPDVYLRPARWRDMDPSPPHSSQVRQFFGGDRY